LADGRGHPAMFREPGHGFPWAWDEEVAVGAAQLTARQSGLLAAVSPDAGGAIAEAELRRAVPWAVVLGRDQEHEDEKDAMAVAGQAGARQEQAEWRAQPAVQPQALQVLLTAAGPQAQAQQLALGRWVLLQGPLAQGPRLAVAQQAWVLSPRVLEQGVPLEPQLAPEPLVSERPEGAPKQQEDVLREREPVLAPVAFAALLLRPLPSRNGRLRRRFRHPPRPSGDA
jgi:hypothetical protein